jgi:hypothetical protein
MKQLRRALHDVEMPVGEEIEAAGIDRRSHEPQCTKPRADDEEENRGALGRVSPLRAGRGDKGSTDSNRRIAEYCEPYRSGDLQCHSRHNNEKL